MHLKMYSALPSLDRIEICYHAGERYGEPCNCRKPRTGLILRSAAELKINLGVSYVIGDRWRDVDCARAAGCRAIFIQRGYEESLREVPDFTVPNSPSCECFFETLAWILLACSVSLHNFESTNQCVLVCR
jgi:D-glycero-D-manno-heptose 1,7-bisphosphate phosphatase